MAASRGRWSVAGWAGVALGLTALAFWFVIGAFFWADDFLNLYEIVNGDFGEFMLRMHGGHLLLVRNIVAVLSFQAFGPQPAGYFFLAFLTHLVNTLLLFRVVQNLTGSAQLACFGAALWGTLPIEETALTWYAVYGQVLAGAFLLAVLSGLTGAGVSGRVTRSALGLWAALLLAASTCFGVGLGVVLLMPVVAFLVLPRSPLRTRIVLTFALVAAAVLCLYLGTQQLYVRAYGGTPPSAGLVAGLAHWPQHLRLFLDLLGVATTCVVTGPWCDPELYPGPLAYVLLALATLAVITLLVLSQWTARRRVLAVLVLAAAAYGIIAAGRGLFVTPENASWMARTPRFHYLGTMPLAIAICLVLARVGDRLRPSTWLTTCALLACVAVSAGSSVRTTIMTRRAPGLAARTETTRALAAMRATIETAAPGADVYIENRPLAAAGPMLLRAPELFPGWAGLFAIHFPTNLVDGHRVFFIEPNARVLAATKTGRRTAGLLVARRAAR